MALGVDVGLAGEQQSRDVLVAMKRSPVQSRHAIVPGVTGPGEDQVGIGLEQRLDPFQIASLGRRNKGSWLVSQWRFLDAEQFLPKAHDALDRSFAEVIRFQSSPLRPKLMSLLPRRYPGCRAHATVKKRLTADSGPEQSLAKLS